MLCEDSAEVEVSFEYPAQVFDSRCGRGGEICCYASPRTGRCELPTGRSSIAQAAPDHLIFSLGAADPRGTQRPVGLLRASSRVDLGAKVFEGTGIRGSFESSHYPAGGLQVLGSQKG